MGQSVHFNLVFPFGGWNLNQSNISNSLVYLRNRQCYIAESLMFALMKSPGKSDIASLTGNIISWSHSAKKVSQASI